MAPIVKVSDLDKYFGRLHVLKKINLEIQPRKWPASSAGADRARARCSAA